ncbi:hypothetical protein VCHA50O413_10471 [Vibrio chagasii]|nr:hypothetical protein VCHA32P90_120030 [Vibrio chagasii]CAH6807674.1 hypothetical protein VCHA35O137_120106 [Vibrio chagasii]CAH6812582.1 hypothetical protein VCHA34P116_130106 [Vibrio chagasii]CAH6841065.1 hypothetical protein VCHA34P114_10444 [Vibrio chagasii]CAH6850474.1 hypothetical protein VCHA36P168_10108 [Vibrio chagasii]
MMNYHFYMLVHCLGAFVDGAIQIKDQGYWKLSGFDDTSMVVFNEVISNQVLGAKSERVTLHGISYLYYLYSRSRLFLLH